MKHHLLTTALLATAFLTGATLLAEPGATLLAEPEEEPCQLTIEPAVVDAGASARLTVALSRWVGAVSKIEIDTESGAQILENRLDDTTGYKVTVDLAAARAGDWLLRFHGERGVCDGTVTVRDNA